MAVKSLSNIKAETGRDLTGLTNDNTLLFAETSNGTDGVATVAELTKGCMKETNGTVTGDHNFTGSLKVGGEDVLTDIPAEISGNKNFTGTVKVKGEEVVTLKKKTITEKTFSEGMIDSEIPITSFPICFKPTNRNGWTFSFIKDTNVSQSNWVLKGYDVKSSSSLITGSVSGEIAYL